jgi:hypothetical protein
MYIHNYIGETIVWIQTISLSHARWHLVEDLIFPGRYTFNDEECILKNVCQLKMGKPIFTNGCVPRYWLEPQHKKYLRVAILKPQD